MVTEKEWDEDGLDEGFNQSADRYRGRAKKKDLIRIISKPVFYDVHSVWEKKLICNCSKEKGKCLFCEQGYDRSLKAGAVIIHIGDKDAEKPDMNWKEVGEPKVWLFGGDKVKTLKGIQNDYPIIKQKGLRKFDLMVTTDDEQKQVLQIRPTMSKTLMKKTHVIGHEEATKQLAFFTNPTSLKRQKEMLGMNASSNDEEEERNDLGGDFDENSLDNKEEGKSEEKMDSGERTVRDRVKEMEQAEKEKNSNNSEGAGLGDLLDELGDDTAGEVDGVGF